MPFKPFLRLALRSTETHLAIARTLSPRPISHVRPWTSTHTPHARLAAPHHTSRANHPAAQLHRAFSTLHRAFSTTPRREHGHLDPPAPGEELHVTFIDKASHSHTFAVAAGSNLLDIAQAHDLEMEGACGGSCACSTCHVIVDEAKYGAMPEPDDDENDMLDLAFGLTETSRLGCQVVMTREVDGLVVRLPGMTRNLQASDFK
ncbi:ferredoxin [Lizonia empirigonia]|nr:ferredoxin [Lizonia empirigonia]